MVPYYSNVKITDQVFVMGEEICDLILCDVI